MKDTLIKRIEELEKDEKAAWGALNEIVGRKEECKNMLRLLEQEEAGA